MSNCLRVYARLAARARRFHDVRAFALLLAGVACASPGHPAPVVTPARDSAAIQERLIADEVRLEQARAKAHWEQLETNARVLNELLAQYHAAHCPPSDALSTPQPSRAQEDRTPLDSARGTILLCGPNDRPLVALVPTSGQSIALSSDREPIELMPGLEVTVFGTRSTGDQQQWPRFEVRRVVVRGNAGRPANDGILRRERDGDYLELIDGRRLRIPLLPTLLEPANGLRVWMVGPPSDSMTGNVLVPWRDELFRRRPETDSSSAPPRRPR